MRLEGGNRSVGAEGVSWGAVSRGVCGLQGQEQNGEARVGQPPAATSASGQEKASGRSIVHVAPTRRSLPAVSGLFGVSHGD